MFTERRLLWGTVTATVVGHAGAHLDAWTHVHQGFAIDSFWTAPHLVLYAGKAATALLIAWYALERRSGLPPGYPVVLIGVGLFGLGGAFDGLWHTWVGFEITLETLLSPAHLWLVASGFVGAGGLLRAALAYRRAHPGARGVEVPVIAAVAMLLRLTLWSTFYSDPLAVDYATEGRQVGHLPAFPAMAWTSTTAAIAGTAGVVAHSVVLALFVVVSVRHLRLPAGSVAAIVGWNGCLTVAIAGTWRLLPAVAAAAVAGAVVAAPRSPAAAWALGSAVPAVEIAGILACLAADAGGLRWTPSVWVGAPVLAGLSGLVVALGVVPPHWVRAAGGASDS